jgi:hypothetical protein
MANENIIHTHESYAEAGEHDSHPSLASHRRREQEAANMLWEWRTDKVEYYEKRTGSVEGDRWTPYNQDRIDEIRQELKGMCE